MHIKKKNKNKNLETERPWGFHKPGSDSLDNIIGKKITKN